MKTIGKDTCHPLLLSGSSAKILIFYTRESLLDLLDQLHYKSQKCFYASDRYGFAEYAADVMELADDIDMLLSARKEFLLGPWVESAKAYGTTDAERDLYEWNAKTQITLWGVPGSVLNDYACKSWSGLVKDFYKKRYELFYQGRMHALESGQPFDYDGFVEECLAFEKAWTEGHDLYPVEPSGSEIDICLRLWSKYRRNMHGMQ